MRSSNTSWFERHGKPCKVGTMPMVVRVHGSDWRTIAPGRYVRVQYTENGHWEEVLVTRVDPDGYFMANR